MPAISRSFGPKVAGLEKKIGGGDENRDTGGAPRFPAGLFVLARPIMLMLYPREPEAWMVMQVLALGFVFLAVIQTATGMLQGIGKPIIPVKNLLMRLGFQTGFYYFLTGVAAINIRGAALGTVVGYMVAAVLDYAAVKREIGIRIGIMDSLIKPAAATVVMSAAAATVYAAALKAVAATRWHLCGGFLAGAAVYGMVLVLIIGGVTAGELELMPGGKRITSCR